MPWMQCSSCGARIPQGLHICPRCRNSLSPNEPAAPILPEQPVSGQETSLPLSVSAPETSPSAEQAVSEPAALPEQTNSEPAAVPEQTIPEPAAVPVEPTEPEPPAVPAANAPVPDLEPDYVWEPEAVSDFEAETAYEPNDAYEPGPGYEAEVVYEPMSQPDNAPDSNTSQPFPEDCALQTLSGSRKSVSYSRKMESCSRPDFSPAEDEAASVGDDRCTVGACFWTYLLLLIPVVGLVLALIWSAGSKRLWRQNLASAALILKLTALLLIVLLAIGVRLYFAPRMPELPKKLDPYSMATPVFDLLGFSTDEDEAPSASQQPPSQTEISDPADSAPEDTDTSGTDPRSDSGAFSSHLSGLREDAASILEQNSIPLQMLIDGQLTVDDINLIVNYLDADRDGRLAMGMSEQDIAQFDDYILSLQELAAESSVSG